MTSTPRPLTAREILDAAEAEDRKKRTEGGPSSARKTLDEAAQAGVRTPLGASEVGGDQLANTIALGMLDKIRGPMAGFVNRANAMLRPSAPALPEPSSEDVAAQLKQGEIDQPGAAMAGKAGGRAIQGLALGPLLPFATTAGGAAATGAATAGLPSAAQNAIEYGRGKKTGTEALAETGVDTLAGAAIGPLARFAAGRLPKIPGTDAFARLTGGEAGVGTRGVSVLGQQVPETTLVPPKGGFLPTAGPPAPVTAIPKGPIKAVADQPMRSVGDAAMRAFINSGSVAGAVGFGAGGSPGVAASLAPPALAAARAITQNAGTNAAQQALALLEANPNLARQIAGNRTAFEEVMRALLAAGTGPQQMPATPQP